jgi:hypothetical protein
MAGIDRKVKERQRQNKQAEKRVAKAAKKQTRKAARGEQHAPSLKQ